MVDLYQSYIQNGFLTDELIPAALCLAHLEGSHRSGIFNEADLVTSDERDVADLRQLMSLVREQDFSSRKACYLNPTLGSTDSNADLIIDDKLIDIKTTKYLVLDRRHLHQLVQCYILLSVEGIYVGGKRHINYFEEECEVNQICIYFFTTRVLTCHEDCRLNKSGKSPWICKMVYRSNTSFREWSTSILPNGLRFGPKEL